ncbi:MAG: Holliday junction branch migration protein RuvA [Anaerolineae bacterium]|nr:Holliday junction branch migration protein RuvA [Anaerolineae bacterium]
MRAGYRACTPRDGEFTMIARLSGTIWDIGEDYLIVRTDGLGFQVRVPATVLTRLGGIGQPVELFTYLYIRENELALFGFLSEEELSLFKLLLTVSGVGPKVALALLNTISPDTLRQAVLQDEPALLSRVPGIGPKTAKAIIFHLKDKMLPTGVAALPLPTETDAEVIAALTGLGFSLVEAQRALQSLPRDEGLPLEERIRLALAYLATL